MKTITVKNITLSNIVRETRVEDKENYMIYLLHGEHDESIIPLMILKKPKGITEEDFEYIVKTLILSHPKELDIEIKE